MRVLILRFDAPLISFGGPMVDHNGVVQTFPGLSMLTGLLSNALGFHHRNSDALSALQDRIRYAGRIDRRGELLVDYQTVDLGKEWMVPENAGWTTRGRLAQRAGASGDATHQRWRHYRADSVHTVALTLIDEERPTLDDITAALREPARPLFLGRKCCLPASRILADVVEAPTLLAALANAARIEPNRGDDAPLPATWWDGDDTKGVVGESHVVPVTDERDWTNQVHTGRRLMREGRIDPPPASSGESDG
jgi:CRISPR system Cascade subunit CasD